jgi:fucose permease
VSFVSLSPTQTKNLRTGYVAWAILSLFFFYQYILRVFPGVMVNELRGDFSINAEQFSYFGAFYLYAYSLLQIPVGLLVDKIGVKKTVILSILICLASRILQPMIGTLNMPLLAIQIQTVYQV